MDFRLDLHHPISEIHVPSGLPEEIDICTPEEYKCNSNDLNGFTEMLSASNLMKKLKDPDIWSGPKVPLLLAFMKELGPKVKNSPQFSNKHKAWTEIQRRFDQAGYTMTVKQISNKYCSLVRQYERVKKKNKETGKNKKCFYGREIERVRAVWPRCLRDSNSGDDSMGTSGKKNLDGDSTEEVNDSCYWHDHRVKFLLSCIKELLPRIGDTPEFNRKMDMWQEIVSRFNAKGYQVSMQQVVNKYASLMRQYRRAKTSCKVNGQPLSCAYKEEIEKILATQRIFDCEEMRGLESYEDMTCTTNDSYLDDQELTNPTKSSSSFALEKNQNCPTATEQNFNGKLQLKDIKENYYIERIDYYKRKKLHLQRKEEHMKKKEALLESILSQLECKMY